MLRAVPVSSYNIRFAIPDPLDIGFDAPRVHAVDVGSGTCCCFCADGCPFYRQDVKCIKQCDDCLDVKVASR